MLVISLLITILTQIVSALFNHRGGNLKWGLKTLFRNIDPVRYPQLATNAEAVATAVLRHCLISDSWFSGNRAAQWFAGCFPRWFPFVKWLFERFELASAIRPKELVDILGQIAALPPASLAALSPQALAQLSAEINDLMTADSTSAAREMELATHVAATAVAAIPGQGNTPLLQESVNAVRSVAGNLEAWFGSTMDRVAQNFAMYMRIWTVFFAAAFAFGTGLNSISLISDLYSNGTLRSALVGAGASVSATASTVLDPQKTLAATLTNALRQALQDTNVTTAPQVPAIQTTAAAIAWIQANVPAAQSAAVVARFNTVSTEASQKFIQDLAQNAVTVIDASNKAGFEVIKWRWPAKWWTAKWLGAGYLAGVLMTVALLSLGAPFWFNALKSMTNLRPILAAKEKTGEA